MRLTPLVLHAAARIPALTSLFSDPFPVASLAVTEGGDTVLTTPTAHGLANGEVASLCITDTDAPNPVTAAVPNGHDVAITLAHPHDLTLTPPNTSGMTWDLTAKLSGFTNPVLNGDLQLVAIDSETGFTIKASAVVPSITLNGTEALLERLEDGIIGWHAAVATGPNTLSFATPPNVARSYEVTSPTVVCNVRVGATMNLDTAKKQYVRGYKRFETDQNATAINHAWMFICPWPRMVLSRDRNAQSDAMTEWTAATEGRFQLIDGYYVFVALPAEMSGGGVGPADLANGEVLGAVLRTFHGLALPRREFFEGDKFRNAMLEHGQALGDYDGATYWHGYSFEAPVPLTQWDSIQPFEWSIINETTLTATTPAGPGSAGGELIPGSIAAAGSVAFREIVFGPESEGKGIRHDSADLQPLTATVKLT